MGGLDVAGVVRDGAAERKRAWRERQALSGVLFFWCLAFLVPVTGIELVTFALRMRCSTN
jgi:hypothetical protein